MKNFDFKEIEKWRLIYRGTIKRILCLAKSTSNYIMEELRMKFGLQPTSLIKQTDEQIARLLTYKKQGDGEIFKKQIDEKFEEFQLKRSALFAEMDKIRQDDLLIIQQQGFYPNFSHKNEIFTSFWILGKIQTQLEKCNQCGCQWSFVHVEKHDHMLYQDYLIIEDFINQCTIEQSLCYKIKSLCQTCASIFINQISDSIKLLNRRHYVARLRSFRNEQVEIYHIIQFNMTLNDKQTVNLYHSIIKQSSQYNKRIYVFWLLFYQRYMNHLSDQTEISKYSIVDASLIKMLMLYSNFNYSPILNSNQQCNQIKRENHHHRKPQKQPQKTIEVLHKQVQSSQSMLQLILADYTLCCKVVLDQESGYTKHAMLPK